MSSRAGQLDRSVAAGLSRQEEFAATMLLIFFVIFGVVLFISTLAYRALAAIVLLLCIAPAIAAFNRIASLGQAGRSNIADPAAR